MTSMGGPTGMGSGLAEMEAAEENRNFRYDAVNLAETITKEYLNVVKGYTFPEIEASFRYVIDADKPNISEYMEAVERFIKIGGTVIEDDVRATLGLERPDTDEDKLGATPGVPQPELPGLGEPRGIPGTKTGAIGDEPESSSKPEVNK